MAAKLDEQTVRFKGRVQALGYSDQAQLSAAASGNAMTTGAVSAVGALIGGGADVYATYNAKGAVPKKPASGSSDNLS